MPKAWNRVRTVGAFPCGCPLAGPCVWPCAWRRSVVRMNVKVEGAAAPAQEQPHGEAHDHEPMSVSAPSSTGAGRYALKSTIGRPNRKSVVA